MPSSQLLLPGLAPVAGKTLTATFDAWRFMLRDSVWELPGVVDVTDPLRAAEAIL